MIKIEKHPNPAHEVPVERMPLPAKVYVPLAQHIGKSAEPLVTVGDTVETGQCIGSAKAHVSAAIHASVSGKVAAIRDWPHPVTGKYKSIVIESDGLDRRPPSAVRRPPEEVDKLSADDIRKIVYESGIVGMGGAGFPTHVKLQPPKPVDTLIVNGAECEPFISADHRLMVERTRQILLGIGLVQRCLQVKDIVIIIEDNKPEAIEAFKNDMQKLDDANYEIRAIASKYPQGGEKQLVKGVTGREVPRGKLPFDAGVVVHNVATINAIYEAVCLGKPLYGRIVTVTGTCLRKPKNLIARIGTPIKDLIAFCGPLEEKPAKIVLGGPMMGLAQYTTDVPVIKTTNGILLFNEKEARRLEEDICIRCGACVRECPAGLMPCLINLASEKEKWEQALGYNAADCIECGLCNYVCPARRRIVQTIKRAKMEAGK